MPTNDSSVPKAKVFALAAAFSVIRDAVSQVTKYTPEQDDRIVFNSLVKALDKASKEN